MFREQFDVNDLEQIKKKLKKATKNLIGKLLVSKLHKSGVMPVEEAKEGDTNGKKRKAVARAHGFRKFVNTNFIHAGLYEKRAAVRTLDLNKALIC